jgi:hypothetical protein
VLPLRWSLARSILLLWARAAERTEAAGLVCSALAESRAWQPAVAAHQRQAGLVAAAARLQVDAWAK